MLAVVVTTAAPAGAIAADGAALATTPAPTVDVVGTGNGISASPGPSTRPSPLNDTHSQIVSHRDWSAKTALSLSVQHLLR
jgi:hypothetical protein